MKQIFIRINDVLQLTLEMDEETLAEIEGNSNAMYNYITELQHRGLIQLVEEINEIETSSDNINFTKVWPGSVESDNIVEDEKDKTAWKENETKLLLDKYEQYLPNVGPLKRFKKKKLMWQQIAEDINKILLIDRSALQCENRFKTIMKRKKTAEAVNRRTGESPERIEYEEEIAKIGSIDDSIQPEKRGRKTMQETLWDIQKYKEEQREKRHREKMELIASIGEKLCKKET